jgi:hypothetical protein
MIKKFLSIAVTLRVVEKAFKPFTYNYPKEYSMRSIKSVLVTAVVVISAIIVPATASATTYHGACGGGNNLHSAVTGWQRHGVADDVIKMTGQTVGLDGSNVQAMAKVGLVRVTVSRNTWVNNFTCTGGRFKGVGRKFLHKGYVLWVPAKSIHGHFVSQALQSLCGNKATGHIPIVVPHKKHKKKVVKKTVTTPAQVVCPANSTLVMLVNSGLACQANSSSETSSESASVANDCKGPNYNSSQCQTTIIQITYQNTIQINANCSQVTVNFSNGDQTVTYYDNDGNVISQAICSTVVTQPPPPQEHAPQISCVFPPHIYVGGSQAMFCEASDSDGDALSVNVVGDSFAHAASTVTVDVRWDGSGCPSGITCYRTTLWGDNVGWTHLTATVTANGASSTSVGDVQVVTDEF